MLKKTALAFALAAGALMADDPTITADATSVTVSVPGGYAPRARLVLACAAADRGTQLAAWATTRELCAELPAEGGEFSATLADLGFPDGNCTVRAFFQSEFEKLEYLIVDSPDEYTDPGMLDVDVYGIEYGYKPTGGGNNGKTICALNTEGGAGTHFRFEGARQPAFNFCADNLQGSYQYKGATLKTDGMNTVLAKDSAITVNGVKLGDFRTAPMGLRGSRVRLNTLNPATANDHSFGWWYYLKIWGRDGRLLVDYIPARRTSDLKVGFYDQAEKQFVTPTGGGDFTGDLVVAASAFTDVGSFTAPFSVASRTLSIAIADEVATVTVPAGFATGEKLYIVSDQKDRGLDVEAWHDRQVLCAEIPAGGGSYTCALTNFCSFGSNVLRVFAAEDCTRLASVTVNNRNAYRDLGVTDTLCYGFEYGYQPLNGSANYGKTFAAAGGTVRLERAAGGNSPRYNYCVYNYAYSAQVTLTFNLDGNACNDIVFRDQTLTHNGASKGNGSTAPIGKSDNMLRMNTRDPSNSADYDYGKWYYIRLYARSGVKLVDYVPAKRADGTFGFVDLAGREFIIPTGGGAYTSDNVEQGTVARIIRYSSTAAYESPMIPMTAEWIGGASTDTGVAANWRCRNYRDEILPDTLPRKGSTAVTVAGIFAFSVPTTDDVRWFTIKFENAVLAADADWRGSFAGDVVNGFTVDLDGHNLTVPGLSGSGTITDSAGSGGELRVDVPENATTVNSGVQLTGSLKLVKSGPGKYYGTKTGVNYTGGTVIEEGYAAINSRAHPTGATASLTICTNGVFDINAGNSDDYVWTEFPVILAGGTLENLGSNTSTGARNLGTVRLTEDSKMYAAQYFGFLAQSYAGTTLDLNGHTLEIDAVWSGFRFFNTTIRNGKLNISHGGYIEFDKGTGCDASTVDIDFGVTPRWNVKVPLTVHDLTMRATDEGDTIAGEAKIKILGTFTPYSEYIHNYELQNGSTIDLSVRDTAYPTINPKKNQYRVGFAEGATVTVDVHGREFTDVPTKVISWDEVPPWVTFELDSQSRRRYFSKTTEDGLYVQYRGATVLFIR